MQIETLKSEGIPKKSASVSTYSSQAIFDNRDDEDKVEDRIKSIEETIYLTKYFMNLIDTALKEVKKDKYFKIIQLKYFEEKSIEETAETLGVDPSTVSRNRTRLINKIKVILFSDEVVLDILN